jgi:osmotically-inducible protein OsmY
MCVSCSNSGNGSLGTNGNNQTQSQQSDWETTAKVKEKLMMEGSLSSNARMISVTTNSGVVTLKGTVASKDERRKVIKMVKGVVGVKKVDDQLTVSNS